MWYDIKVAGLAIPGARFRVVLNDPAAFWADADDESLAASYAERLGRYFDAPDTDVAGRLRLLLRGEGETAHLPLRLPLADALPSGYVDLQLPVLLLRRPGQYHAFLLPLSGAEALAPSREEALAALADLVEPWFFSQRGELSHFNFAEILSAAQLSGPEDLAVPVLPAQALAEAPPPSSEERLMALLFEALPPAQAVYQPYGKELEEAQALLRGAGQRNVLIVGPPLSGKSTLVAQLQAPRHKQFVQFRAASAIAVLSGGGSWQDALERLLNHEAMARHLPVSEDLASLFEIGRYEGNPVSLGEYLYPFLKNGQCQMLAECRDAAFQQLQQRYPYILELFHVVRISPPSSFEALLPIVRAAAPAGCSEEAAAMALLLFKRFLPYDGLPGAVLAFLQRCGQAGENIDEALVLRRFSQDSGIPVALLDRSRPLPYPELLAFFEQRLFGQPLALQQACDALLYIKNFISRPERPVASLLFAGPTGTGKTELAKLMAEYIFSERSRIIRFDMSEYGDPYAVNRLTGVAEEDGLLIKAVRRQPFGVLLFDEIEKADESFFRLLLQILEGGRLSSAQGEIVNFCSTLIIMTSNIGAAPRRRVSFGEPSADEGLAATVAHYEQAVRQYFPPELYNRFDKIVPFSPLDRAAILRVVERELAQMRELPGLSRRFAPVAWELAPEVSEHLVNIGYNAEYGARDIKRTLRRHLVEPLARLLSTHDEECRLRLRATLSADGLPRWEVLEKGDPFKAGIDALGASTWTLLFADQRLRLERLYRKGFIAEWRERFAEQAKPEAQALYDQRFVANAEQDFEAVAAALDDLKALELDLATRLHLGDGFDQQAAAQGLQTWKARYHDLWLRLLPLRHPGRERQKGYLRLSLEGPYLPLAARYFWAIGEHIGPDAQVSLLCSSRQALPESLPDGEWGTARQRRYLSQVPLPSLAALAQHDFSRMSFAGLWAVVPATPQSEFLLARLSGLYHVEGDKGPLALRLRSAWGQDPAVPSPATFSLDVPKPLDKLEAPIALGEAQLHFTRLRKRFQANTWAELLAQCETWVFADAFDLLR